MLTVTYVPSRYWFYPIGNTPAVNLFRDFRPAEDVNVLSVACGDVRNILFSLWTEEPSPDQNFRFTVCDYEPAILARNILLLSLLIDTNAAGTLDQRRLDLLWDVYYHLYLTSEALSLIADHTARLLAESTTIETWNDSVYGASLQFLSKNTWVETRQYWQRYLDACSSAQGTNLKDEIPRYMAAIGFEEDDRQFSGVRSTGIHYMESFVMSTAHRKYWATGVVAGNVADVTRLQKDNGGHANPLFTVSSAPSGTFAVHYGSDPLVSYHLAEAFDMPQDEPSNLECLASLAKSQFREWCKSFAAHTRLNAVKLKFHGGHALNLCYALQKHICGSSILWEHVFTYVRPWSAATLDIVLDHEDRACRPFDIIDTSNISDYVGILNLIPAILPLLTTSPGAVFYVETLLPTTEDTREYLRKKLRADPNMVGLLFGAVPESFLTGVTTEHYAAEDFLNIYANQCRKGQTRVRTAWRCPSDGDQNVTKRRPLHVDHDQLASFMFEWYLSIFSDDEDPSKWFARSHSPQRRTLNYNSRITLVALLGLLRRTVQTDWSRCIGLLTDKITHDRNLPLGSTRLPELIFHLYQSILWETEARENTPSEFARRMLAAGQAFLARESLGQCLVLPNVLYIVLAVPREKLSVLTSAEVQRIGSPGLYLTISSDGLFEYEFFATHFCFGQLSVDQIKRSAVVEEDALGWRGQSTLIVTCAVPGSLLLSCKEEKIRVALVTDPLTSITYFVRQLGPRLQVFAASVASTHVEVLRAPVGRSHIISPLDSPTTQFKESSQALTADLKDESLKGRVEITERPQLNSLRSGAKVVVVQRSPCTIAVSFGPHTKTLEYPYPVDSSLSKTLVSRKKGWIEVASRLSDASKAKGYALTPFSVIRRGDCVYTWCLSRVNLARQPSIPNEAPLRNLPIFMGLTASQAEHESSRKSSGQGRDSKSWRDLKESLSILFVGHQVKAEDPSNPPVSIAGFKPSCRAFGLAVGGINDTLILVKSIHHDLDLSSAVLDAFVVPLSFSQGPQLQRKLAKVREDHPPTVIHLSQGAAILWKHLLPALVERCRRGWRHTDKCEYGTDPFVCPRTTAFGGMPICSCGEGKEADQIPKVFAKLGPYATRIAIPPLSAVPLVEELQFDNLVQTPEVTAVPPPHNTTTEQARDAKVMKCSHCKSTKSGLKTCSGCGVARYCDKTCQRQGWKAHKPDCKKK